MRDLQHLSIRLKVSIDATARNRDAGNAVAFRNGPLQDTGRRIVNSRILAAINVAAALVTVVAAAAVGEFRAPVKLRDVSASARAEPFKGITTSGNIVPGLFALAQTGVSTDSAREAAAAFVASLSDLQRQRTLFAVDDDVRRG